ncbi:uncharacterized protein BDZ99DRAFT_527277 [Mytilinidion resinicola]|uniref:F-box domain-containing protein n=1 Tax=Mytilinidion resinicola TaxID=574789 RepID=A0A6A6Y169_9PEZI|nr:uncharacterized protein BDZ99DRAFT_527277 [Mytilinidion resinicola]KAF2802551.1 hypothetical protein BDZ99DRAFT_527277 [Mytilinidion resinicola]
MDDIHQVPHIPPRLQLIGSPHWHENIPAIPPELLHIICNFLDIPTLKAFRRASSAYNTIAVTHLFSEAYLRNNMTGFNRLLALVTKGPQFAQHIKSLECVEDPSRVDHLDGYSGLSGVLHNTGNHIEHDTTCKSRRCVQTVGSNSVVSKPANLQSD